MLGFRPNLGRIQKMYPGAADWEPELFPGLTLQVWLSKKSQCKCPKKRHKQNDSCACNSTCLVFDTGNMVVTGVSNHVHAALVCDCVRLFLSNHQELHDNTAELPRNLRFNHRRLQKLADIEVDFLGTYKQSEKPASVLDRVSKPVTLAKPVSPQEPIFQACDGGQVDMVNFLVMLDADVLNTRDAQGRTPHQRVQDNPTRLSDAVVDQLLKATQITSD